MLSHFSERAQALLEDRCRSPTGDIELQKRRSTGKRIDEPNDPSRPRREPRDCQSRPIPTQHTSNEGGPRQPFHFSFPDLSGNAGER